jgi:hypothetical protein
VGSLSKKNSRVTRAKDIFSGTKTIDRRENGILI